MSRSVRFLLGLVPGGLIVAACAAGGEPIAVQERGAALFQDKGCASCHAHARVAGSGRHGGGGNAPDLTTYRNDPALLRRWLTDPSAVKPATKMPALALSDAELDDLIAFLNATP